MADAPPAFWVTADEQQNGRGRLGREWTSEVGNFYGSLTLREPAQLACASALSLVAGVGVRSALVAATRSDAFRLKWPNDVLLDGAKVAGILLEGFHRADRFWVSIGIGVNCANHPGDTPYPATHLDEHGLVVSPDDLFAHLDGELAATIERWERGAMTERFVDEWTRHAHGLGVRTTVRTPGGTVTGILRGLAPDGRLLLDADDGMMMIAAGDVAAR